MAAWVLAAVAIAVVTSIVLTELLVLIGAVDWASPQYAWVINTVALVTFLVLVSVPLVFRSRFVDRPTSLEGE